MSIVTKLIGMVALGQTAVETRIAVQNFLANVTTALGIAVAAGLMVGALLIGSHVIVYQLLLNYTDLSALEAMSITLALGVILTGIVVIILVQQLKHAFTFPKQLEVEPYQQPVSSRIAGIAEAFFDGLTGRKSRF